MAALEKQQKGIQEAVASKPTPAEDNFQLKAMGAIEEGDALFGSGAEVNLDSQVGGLGLFTFALNF